MYISHDQTIDLIVQRHLLSCSATATVCDAARLMAEARCSSIVVVDRNRPIGIWTERDALKLNFADETAMSRPIAEVMSAPVMTIALGATVGEAGMRFKLEGIRHLVVLDQDGAALGIISQSDVVLSHRVEHFLVLRTVDSALKRPMLALPPGCSLSEATERMRANGVDAAVVQADGQEGAGIVTERDVVRVIAAGRPLPGKIGQIASRPLLTMGQEDSLLAARNLLQEQGIRHLGVTDGSGQLVGLLSFADILSTLHYEYVQRLDEALHERDLALLRSRKDLTLAKKVIEASVDGVMIADANGCIEYINPAFTRLTGYTAAEAIGQNPRMLKSGCHDAEFYRDLFETLSRKDSWRGEIWNRRKNGEIYPEWLTINVIRDDGGAITQYAAIFSDISDRKNDEEQIKRLAYFDALTGIPNRRLFIDRLELAMASAHRHGQMLAVMFLDLDMFKRINDSLGHSVGDEVLSQAASRINGCLREGDTVARLGGDEFTVLLPEIDSVDDIIRLAERLICVFKQPFQVGAHEFFVSTSIGVAVYPDDGANAEILIKNADTAMYRAKESGRNGFHLYAPAMNALSVEHLTMETALRHAIERGELRLAYQAKVDLATGRIAGVEALLRWQHPEKGLVLPADFIPLAENIGLISELGNWVLRTACRQSKSWLDAGLQPVPVAVNVSAQQFRETDMPMVVASALRDTGLPPELLELELTESVLMQRVDEVAEVLRQLREIGIQIAIDDFGTGYSSLSYLTRMPIDSLKVDQSFISAIFGQQGRVGGDGAEIVSTIINLAHNLHLKAIAEGVETAAQVDFLHAAGCDQAQGFLINRPFWAEEMAALLRGDLNGDQVLH